MKKASSAIPSILALVFIFSVVLGQVWKDVSTKSDVLVSSEVEREFKKLVAAFNARDAAAVMSLFARDVILSYPGRRDASYAEIDESFQKMFAPKPDFSVTYATDIEEVQSSGDLAFVRATWTVKWKSGERQGTSQEKDLEIWRRQGDGTWKLARGLSFPIPAPKPTSPAIAPSTPTPF